MVDGNKLMEEKRLQEERAIRYTPKQKQKEEKDLDKMRHKIKETEG